MEENYKTNKAFGDFAKKIGNPYGLEKNKEAVMKVLKAENIDRMAGYKQSEVVKKIAGITGLGWKTKNAVLALGKKESGEVRPKIDFNKTRDEIISKGKKASYEKTRENVSASKPSPVIDLSASQKHMYGRAFVHGTNEKAVANFNHGSQTVDRGDDDIKNRLKNIQS